MPRVPAARGSRDIVINAPVHPLTSTCVSMYWHAPACAGLATMLSKITQTMVNSALKAAYLRERLRYNDGDFGKNSR